MDRLLKMSFWLQWLICSVLAILLFMPVINNSFVSDDYYVIKKVCIDKHLNTDGFFRPLSDITLYLNYMVGGLQPGGFYLFNIIIHALDAVLLFHFCRLWQWTDNKKKQLLFAAISAVLFLTYPFHSESILWILGRASLLASTFGILALVIMVAPGKEYLKIAGVCISYFIALSGYESIMVLPAMVFIWLLSRHAKVKEHVLWMSSLAVTLVLHMLLRTYVSGTVVNDYGSGFFNVGIKTILGNIGKVTGRLFLPPIQNSTITSILFLVVIIMSCLAVIRVWKKVGKDKQAILFFLYQIALLLIALLLPFYFGVSTHTSESDRFLHFPSFFLCSILSFCVVSLLYGKRLLPVVVFALLAYHVYFLQVTVHNWDKASVAIRSLFDVIRKNCADNRKTYVVNLPEEIDGAFVFREGFREALQINRVDISMVRVINKMKRDSLVTLPPILETRQLDQCIYIPPRVCVVKGAAMQKSASEKDEPFTILYTGDAAVVYWNQKEWRLL